MPRKTVTDRELVADVRRVAALLGRKTLRVPDYHKHGRHALSCLYSRFGSWKSTLERAGLSTDRYADLSERELIADVRRVARNMPDGCASLTEYMEHGRYGRRAIWDFFGTWTVAMEQAGLSIRKPAFTVTEQEAIADVRRVARKLRQSHVTVRQYAEHGKFGQNTLIARFGGWPAVLRRCGLCTAYIKTKTVSMADCLADIRRVARRVGTRTPTKLQQLRYGRFSTSPALRLFGSWDNAVRRAGLGRKRSSDKSRQ